MMTFTFLNQHGYNLEFSPHNNELLAVVSSKAFGSTGAGTLLLLEIFENDHIKAVRKLKWTDGLFDLVWSKHNNGILVTSSGDGTLQIWNIFHPEKKKPLICLQEHTSEVFSVDWNFGACSNQNILSGSWDGSIKLWDTNRLDSLQTFVDNELSSIYCARFSPFIPNFFSSVSINGNLKLWNSLDFSGKSTMSIKAHSGEILTCDWNCSHPYLIATGASDKLIRIWDIRYLKNFICELHGNEYAVKQVKFSPHSSNIIASAGYDFKTRIWNIADDASVGEIVNIHTDVVNSVCWNSKRESQLADCGWDSLVNIYSISSLEST